MQGNEIEKEKNNEIINKQTLNNNENNDEKMNKLEDRLEQAGIVKPPDGAFGWAVVFASFCTNGIVDGIIFTVSASLVPRWERFFNNNTVTNVTSLLAGFYLLSGPLASALANSFGCNTVAVAGAFIAAIGFLVSALIPALPVLYVAFGIIGGIGFGLVFLPAIVIVGQYFSEKRALATGIAVCGSGIGTAIFGQINPIILDHFDKLVGEEDSWRIFLLFLSAITLTCAIFGCFFKPLKPSKSQLEQVVKIASEFMGKGGNNEEIILREENEENSKIIRRPSDTTKITQGVEIERFVKPPQNGALSRRRVDSFSQRSFLSTLELLASRHALDQSSTSNANLARKVSKVGVIDLNRPLSRMDVFYTGSTQSLAKRTQNRMPNFSENNFFENKQEAKPSIGKSNLYLSAAGLHTLEGAAKSGIVSSKWTNNIISSLRSMLDLGLLQSPTFLVLAISGFLTLFCFFVPFAFIGELAANKISSTTTTTNNFNKNDTNNLNNSESGSASQLLLVLLGKKDIEKLRDIFLFLGLFNVVGRVLCGYISDHPKVDPLIVSNIALIIGGIATAIAPLLNQLWMFAIYCFPFAFGAASFAALRSIICVELLGIERLSSAFGMLMLFMGVAALFGRDFFLFYSLVEIIFKIF
ncbi:unnamed protein product [Meloidogyne enterolobii]|uniref:Uncharacterized protein n=3 Tax=Meloidogyne enterolobii TaxID=390850 RepID=A0ACB0ZMM2_MELEN